MQAGNPQQGVGTTGAFDKTPHFIARQQQRHITDARVWLALGYQGRAACKEVRFSVRNRSVRKALSPRRSGAASLAYSTPMIKLEDLRTDAIVRGILPDTLVAVVSLQGFGAEAPS